MNKKVKGCLFGCLGAVILAIIFVISGAHWLVKKQDFDQTTGIVRQDSDWYLRIMMAPEDEALIGFMLQQVKAINANNVLYKEVPAAKSFFDWRNERKVRKALPLEIEMEGRYPEKRFNASVGISVYNNLFGVGYFLMKRSFEDKGLLHEYRGIPYCQLNPNGEGFFCFHKNLAYFSDQALAMEGTLDLILAPPAQPHDQLQALDTTQPIYGFAKGAALTELLNATDSRTSEADHTAVYIDRTINTGIDGKPLFSKGAWLTLLDKSDWVRVGLKSTGPDQLEGTITFLAPQNEDFAQNLEQLFADMAQAEKIKLSYQIQPIEEGYAVAFSLTGFQAFFESLSQHLVDNLDQIQ